MHPAHPQNSRNAVEQQFLKRIHILDHHLELVVGGQSGKGGIAYLLESAYGIVMPRRLQVEFSSVVKDHTDQQGCEVNASDIWNIFAATYLETATPVRYCEHHLFEHGKAQGIRLVIEQNGIQQELTGEGNGPIDAAVHALQGVGIRVQVRSYEERSIGASDEAGNAQACAFIELRPVNGNAEHYGVGIDGNIITASIKALVSGVNRNASAL